MAGEGDAHHARNQDEGCCVQRQRQKKRNTAILLRTVLKELEKEGTETELIQLSGAKIHGCLGLPQVLHQEGPPLFADRRAWETPTLKDGGGGRHPSRLADVCGGHLAGDQGADGPRLSWFPRQTAESSGARLARPVVAVRRAGAIHAFDA